MRILKAISISVVFYAAYLLSPQLPAIPGPSPAIAQGVMHVDLKCHAACMGKACRDACSPERVEKDCKPCLLANDKACLIVCAVP